MRHPVPILWACLLSFACCSCKREPASALGPAPPTDRAPVKEETPKKRAPASTPTSRPARSKLAVLLETKDVEAPCSLAEVAEEYLAQLKHGRSMAKLMRWGEATAAFDKALAASPNDPAALSELTYALVRAGDLRRALEAGRRAVAAAKGDKLRKLRAASLYNLGRAAEGSGDLKLARESYRASIALRPHQAVSARLPALKASPPRKLARAKRYPKCQGRPSLAALCHCLAAAERDNSKQAQVGGALSCKAQPKKAAPGIRLLELRGKARPSPGADDDTKISPGSHTIVAVQEVGGWSALTPVMTDADVDPYQTGKRTSSVELVSVKVVPLPGERRLLWIQSKRREEEHAMGAYEALESGKLTLCLLPRKGRAYCHELYLGGSHSSTETGEDGDEKCTHDSAPLAYRARLFAAPDRVALSVSLVRGVDSARRVGRYEL